MGALSVRKGFHILLDAFEKSKDSPIQLEVVGRVNGPFNPATFPSNVKYYGAVSPSEIDVFMRDADVFILPTFSDGFALTQLEAQAYKLPVIATKYCGDVITNGYNGVLLRENTVESICETFDMLLGKPSILQTMSNNSELAKKFSFDSISNIFLNLHNKLLNDKK